MPKLGQIRECIVKIIPTRKAERKRGRRPNIHGKVLGGPKRKEKVADEEIHIGKKQNEQDTI